MTTISESTRKPRHMTQSRDSATTIPAIVAPPLTKVPSKLDRIEAMLRKDSGASIAEIMVATGWQQHSVRGAMAGALKKRGLVTRSDKIEGVRRYRAGPSA
jgi:hypothetical protein